MGHYYRAYTGDTRSLDYSSFHGTTLRLFDIRAGGVYHWGRPQTLIPKP